MTINTGDRLPEATLMKATSEGPKPVNVSEIFNGKTVALFAVPGAFTPTCSARHMPGFAENLETLKAKGVDTVACVSVNDAFVMGAWAQSQDGADKILMLADGNGEFTRAVGLTMDAKGFGMGERSQRYSMLVKDGVVEQLNIEQGGEFKVSSAEHLLGQL
ncbi:MULTISPECIES: peroxiredoxin [unclassified Brevundimonas]|jgi:peroxiredoxin|uniref:peroxiredoxin n=1 Tax=unclassified Brevundimonas TaxID=2622653 RepID=UPI000C4E88A7|nr:MULTISPECIES: peroxiredoxin [unclassified Brevundimonas]MAL89275.1 peroxiredoxin [Brevundimonas sp.]HAJ03504.1 peroxiredoxin [Brevundimonas sp.]|tara:strand:+ start:12880 stop:13362 length:483 start_codon:yes stop_codon:yes gene_type:complete